MKNNYLKVLLLLGLVACGTSEDEVQSEPEISSQNTHEQNESEKSPVEDELECLAQIKVPPGDHHKVHATTGGFITKFNWIEGSQIQKGEIITNITNPEFAILRKNYLSAKADWQYENENFERQKELYEKKSISKKEFLIHQKNHRVALSNYEGLREEINSMGFQLKTFEQYAKSILPIVAPVSGIVSEIFINGSMKVNPSDQLLTIIDTSHIHIEISIPEQYSALVKQGKGFTFTLGGEEYEGEIYKINPMIQSNNQFTAHGHFLGNRPNQMLIGQKLFVKFK